MLCVGRGGMDIGLNTEGRAPAVAKATFCSVGYGTTKVVPSRIAKAIDALLSCMNAKNKRVGVLALWGRDFGGGGADTLSEMPGLAVCAIRPEWTAGNSASCAD